MKKVSIIGIGLGNPDTITVKGQNLIKSADVLIGAKRMLDSFLKTNCKKYEKITPSDILDVVLNEKHSNICVLMSGDTGFFSGATKLTDSLNKHNIDFEIISGISSLSYLSSKILVSYDDAKTLSLHGRNDNPVHHILTNIKTFILCDKENTPRSICKNLLLSKNSNITVYVGENLSYENEKITKGSVFEISNLTFSPLSVVFFINENPQMNTGFGLPDDDFIKTTSPMTKSEVRAVCLSKLNLKPNEISYDIGSGSGSITVEMARIQTFGTVYAIEKKDDAINTTKQNIDKFNLNNVKVIEGIAPDVLKNLQAPDVVFIGGSSGNLCEIIDVILQKNANCRFVVSAITLETISECLGISKRFKNSEICSITVAKSKKIANYNMMMGQNPIFILTFGGEKIEI